MATPDAQLVDQIVAQVMAQLPQGGVMRADVRPVIGTCTGDYSKFAELRDRLTRAENPTPAKAKRSAAPAGGEQDGDPPAAYIAALSGADGGGGAAGGAPRRKALNGFVTGDQLLLAARDGVVCLAADARLTPLAVDTAKEKGIRVERVGAGAASAGVTGASDGGRWLWWIDGRCDVFESLLKQAADRSVAAGQPRKADALHDVVRELAQRVRRGDVAGGVLFVPSASRAICYANRCPSLRAIVGTCDEAVEQGVDQLGANVLVIEYPFHGYRSASVMVDRFCNSARPSLPGVERQLKELSTCG
ncbi:MAG: hypothetical protein CMJ49_11675 [Planctomycetaceae bacterium]|nr:hypothetical protein [Planctomycetaceae bacterium]